MSIDKEKKDYLVPVVQGAIGAIPLVGPLVAEVVGTLIPNQRIDRLIAYVKILNTKLDFLEEEALKQKFTTIESLDLFEDSLYQAARALSNERKEYIAALVKNSLVDIQIEKIQYKQLLSILGELNDVEVLLLKRNSLDITEGRIQFEEQHKHLFSLSNTLSVTPWGVIPKNTFLIECSNHLIRLGLIEDSYVTPLGALLLKSIDQAPDNRSS